MNKFFNYRVAAVVYLLLVAGVLAWGVYHGGPKMEGQGTWLLPFFVTIPFSASGSWGVIPLLTTGRWSPQVIYCVSFGVCAVANLLIFRSVIQHERRRKAMRTQK